jgi:uncharacterized glyoxalase superfamily protein PhnB
MTASEWPSISCTIFCDDASKEIDWLCTAFGFEVRIRIEGEGGRIEHSELTYRDGLVMVGDMRSVAGRPDRGFCKSPRGAGGANTQTMCIRVDDVDAHCAHARASGAAIAVEPRTDDYGDEYGAHRSYCARDPEGHHWWFMQEVRPRSGGGST